VLDFDTSENVNRDQVNATAERVRANALASKRFHCEPCGQALQSQHALDKHLASSVHSDCLAGKSRSSTMSLGAMNVKAKRAADKAARLYHCHVCNKSFPNDSSLTRHQEGPRGLPNE
jgi:transcription elongation factor Elf1